MYHGPPENVTEYFAKLNFPCKPLTNPADHVMSILNSDDIRIKAFERGKTVTNKEVEDQF